MNNSALQSKYQYKDEKPPIEWHLTPVRKDFELMTVSLLSTPVEYRVIFFYKVLIHSYIFWYRV